MLNVLTIDVEDWCQATYDRTKKISPRVVANTTRILEILEERNVKATFFVLGLVGEKYPGIVRDIFAAGHEIGTHGYSHELVFSQSRSEFFDDLRKSIDILGGITGEKVMGYRAPDFSITKRSLWALKVLSECEIEYDSSIFPIYNRRYGIHSWERFPHKLNLNHEEIDLIEFPVSTLRFLGVNVPMGGGGYFRLYPYPIIRAAIMKLNAIGKSAVLYFHPYEVDFREFRELEEKIPPLKKWTQGYNRRKTEIKFRKLITDFKFCPIREILAKSPSFQ